MAGEMRNAAVVGAVMQDAEFIAAMLVGAGKFGRKIIQAISRWAKGRAPEPAPKQDFPKRFHKRVEIIWRALWACGKYHPDTILLYTYVIGKLMVWADSRAITDLAWIDLNQFLDHYVKEGRPRAEQRLKKRHDEDGLAVRYVAFYAVRAVLDRLCGMNVTLGFPPPPRPSRTEPASTAVCRRLFAESDGDREQVLLLLTNGVGLMPSESAPLSWCDFEPGFNKVKVRRQDKTTTVQIDRHVGHLLAECRRRFPERTYVFQSSRSVDPRPVGVRTLQNTLDSLVTRSGLAEHVTLTALRKAAAYVPGITPDGGARHDRKEEAARGTEPTLPKTPPCGPAEDAETSLELRLLQRVPAECVALRRRLVSPWEQAEGWPVLPERMLSSVVQTVDCGAGDECKSADDAPVALFPVPAQEKLLWRQRGSRTILSFAFLARSA